MNEYGKSVCGIGGANTPCLHCVSVADTGDRSDKGIVKD